MTNIEINYIQQENSVTVRNSSTGKFEEIRLTSRKKQGNQNQKLISIKSRIASHILLQVCTA